MKTKIQRSTKSQKYPVLKEMKDREVIVLFTCENVGTVVHSKDTEYSVSDMFTSIHEKNFKPFSGKVTLKN